MGTIASLITSLTIVTQLFILLNRSKKTSNLRVTGLCAGNSPGTGEFPAQMASNAETFSIWWRHHNGETLWAKVFFGLRHSGWGCIYRSFYFDYRCQYARLSAYKNVVNILVNITIDLSSLPLISMVIVTIPTLLIASPQFTHSQE